MGPGSATMWGVKVRAQQQYEILVQDPLNNYSCTIVTFARGAPGSKTSHVTTFCDRPPAQ